MHMRVCVGGAWTAGYEYMWLLAYLQWQCGMLDCLVSFKRGIIILHFDEKCASTQLLIFEEP